MMKISYLLFLFFILTCEISAQILSSDTIPPIKVIVLNKLIHWPSNKIDSIINIVPKPCDKEVHKYFLNRLMLSEDEFLKLNLRFKDVFDYPLYSYQFLGNDTLNCLESINLYIQTKLLIELNETILKPNEIESKLKLIEGKKIKYIHRHCRLLKRDIIQINTDI